MSNGAGAPFTLADVLEVSMRNAASTIHTGIPARVVAYDPVTNTLSAQPAIKEFFFLGLDDEREFDEPPTIPMVPVIWPRAGSKVIRWLIEPGDFVWLAYSEKSLAEWRTTGQLSEPTDSRRHSMGWAYAIPGAFPDTQPLSPLDAAEVAAGGMIIGDDGGTDQIRIGGTTPGVKISSGGVEPISPVALSIPTDAGLATVAAAVTALAVSVNTLITAYNAHKHAGGTYTTTCPAGAGSVSGGASGATDSPGSAAAAGPGAPATTASLKTRSL